jgi:hypothetical protein
MGPFLLERSKDHFQNLPCVATSDEERADEKQGFCRNFETLESYRRKFIDVNTLIQTSEMP